MDSYYIKKLEKEIEDINLIKDNNYKSKYSYGKVLYENPYQRGILHVLVNDTKDIKLNDYVASQNGLVGIVSGISKNEVRVKLITSSDLALQVKVEDCYGIIKNRQIDNLNAECRVNTNSGVVTSNLGYLDEEVPIGFIQNIKSDNNENRIYEVKPYADFNNLTYVLIISGR